MPAPLSEFVPFGRRPALASAKAQLPIGIYTLSVSEQEIDQTQKGCQPLAKSILESRI